MPLFMDTHKNVDGLTVEAVVQAHQADLDLGGPRGVHYLKYWFNAQEGTVFCLVEAPDAESAVAVHRNGHGLVADNIVEVEEGS